MPKKPPMLDPGGAHRRRVVAARRVGIDSRCSCGEKRPEALIAGSKPIICAACKRANSGLTTLDNHHFAGKANHLTTIPVPVNDHRARLSVAQADWPKATRTNPQGSPLLAAAACVRGFVDTVLYLIEMGLLWTADMLEKLDEFQVRKLGPRWWVKTEIEQFAPKDRSNGQS
ncbi:MAG: hypothetical protein LAO03_21330 [Acidobacteriia bacterium]|nr:hypothetical protein [Terriglobia bacterium]